MKRSMILAVIVLLSWASASAQGDFRTVVKAVETKYAVHHHGFPGLWIAKPFMIGSGVSGLKMALFDGFDCTDVTSAEFESVLKGTLGPEWLPFASVVSKHERTVIYTRPSGSKLAMLIANFEGDGLTLMQMNVGSKAMHDWVDEPVQTARTVIDGTPTSQGGDNAEALVSSR
jgi:hypothetical protein